MTSSSGPDREMPDAISDVEADLLDLGQLGSFAFSLDEAKQALFDDDDLQMLVYTGPGMDGNEASGPGAPTSSFLGWSASVPVATSLDIPNHIHTQAFQAHPTSDNFFRGSDNQSSLARSSVPSVFERNSSEPQQGLSTSGGPLSASQLPILNSTYSADIEPFYLDGEGSVDTGSHGSGGCKKRVRIPSEVKVTNKRSPGTRGPFHPSGPCLLTDMTEEYNTLERVLAMSSVTMENAEDADLYVPKRGKGGRNPALDARLDPSIDPKKAARIMANRLSAARSKMRRKMQTSTEGMQSKLVLLESQKHRLEREMERLDKLCNAMELEVYGGKVSSGVVGKKKGVLKASAGIAFDIDFANPMAGISMDFNPMAAVPMDFNLPPVAPSCHGRHHQHSASWSPHMDSGFMDSMLNENFDAAAGPSWQSQAAALLEQMPFPQGLMMGLPHDGDVGL